MLVAEGYIQIEYEANNVASVTFEIWVLNNSLEIYFEFHLNILNIELKIAQVGVTTAEKKSLHLNFYVVTYAKNYIQLITVL